MLAGHCCPEALSSQACRAEIQESISPVGQEDIFMIHNRAVPSPTSAVLQLPELQGRKGWPRKGIL